MAGSEKATGRPVAGFSYWVGSGPAIWSALVAALLCAVVAVCGWIPFGWLGISIRSLIAPSNCAAFQAGTSALFVCSAKVAMLTLIGPIGFAVLLSALFFLFRNWTVQGLAACARKIPNRFRYIVAPLIATFFFTIIWAGSHYGMAFRFGLMPQILFPAVTGLFSWAVMRYDPKFRQTRVFSSFLAWRDKVPLLLRIAVMLLASVLFSLSITLQNRVSYAALKEQIVVVITLVIGYILLSKISKVVQNPRLTNEALNR
jgi:hypothetical protein